MSGGKGPAGQHANWQAVPLLLPLAYQSPLPLSTPSASPNLASASLSHLQQPLRPAPHRSSSLSATSRLLPRLGSRTAGLGAAQGGQQAG